MKVHCTKCGEELLGAVNRCWKCGTQFVPNPDPSAPPVRTIPPTSDLADEAAPQPTAADSVDTLPGDESAGDVSVEVVVPPLPVAQQYSLDLDRSNREKGAVASLMFSGIGFVALMLPPSAIFLGLLGILLGVYGIESKSRLIATIGLVLNVLVLIAGIIQLALRL